MQAYFIFDTRKRAFLSTGCNLQHGVIDYAQNRENLWYYNEMFRVAQVFASIKESNKIADMADHLRIVTCKESDLDLIYQMV